MNVKLGRSHRDVPAEAADEIARALELPGAAFGVFFCPPQWDLAAFGAALNERLAFPLFGCTTAGEIHSSSGYSSGEAVACCVAGPGLVAHVRCIQDLEGFDETRAKQLTDELASHYDKNLQRFAMLLVDGLSMREEQVVATLHGALGEMPLVGASAGDGERFQTAWVYDRGQFRTRAASLCVVETSLPFRAFSWHHFTPTPHRMVVTGASPTKRQVHEIDGLPAAQAYAAALGVKVEELNSSVFARHPVGVRVGSGFYLRSIRAALPDGTLRFYCDIEEGMVLTVAAPLDQVESLEQNLAALKRELGDIALLVGFDCILRRGEAEANGVLGRLGALLQQQPTLGFSTYGEVRDGVHINQTLTGVALGRT